MEQPIDFMSEGLTLRGFLHRPKDTARPHPAIILCHGFGGSCRGAGHPELARALEDAGYAVLRFDFRGCGQSEGPRGEVICDEEVADLVSAIDFLETQPGIDERRIGVIGASLGGSVALAATAREPRLRLCAANGSVGDGERRFRAQYPGDAAWQAFRARLDAAKHERATTGRAVMLNRFDIVAIPEEHRAGLPPGAIMEFTAETAMSMLDFSPERMVHEIAPRPLLLIHPRGDAVVPVTESEALAAAAGANCEIYIIESREHFGSGSREIVALTLAWLSRHLPPD